jgi:AraC family L-rhamnose operon regulatory protein RhaS
MAAELLKNGSDRTITEIALDCGFSSSQYFATLFRHQFDVSPRAWRSHSLPL